MNIFSPLMYLLGVIAGLVTIKGYYQSAKLGNSFEITPGLFSLGVFVWGDALTIGPYWILVAFLSGTLQDVHLFFVCITTFWFVRAYGEVQYWIAEQFTSKPRNKPKDLWGHQFFEGEAVYFGYQTFWQVVMMISGIATLANVKMWLF